MVPLTALWMPIVLSAILVFVASSVIHMVFTYHRKDYSRIPNEKKVMDVIGGESLKPGTYIFPCPESPKDWNTPEHMERYKEGPVGILTMFPNAPPVMAKHLSMWFGFCLLMGVFIAYLAGRTLGTDAPYLTVFRIAGTVGFLGYGASQLIDSIWKGQEWSTTARHVFDGLVYSLLTAGVFGWLWPR